MKTQKQSEATMLDEVILPAELVEFIDSHNSSAEAYILKEYYKNTPEALKQRLEMDIIAQEVGEYINNALIEALISAHKEKEELDR